MRQAIPVVRYDCQTLQVLPDCTVEGTYGFLGMTTKSDVVRLNDAMELQANLPLYGAKLGASLGTDTSLDVALVMVGKRVTTRGAAGRDQLRGSCAGATHFVKSATIGAFALNTGAKAQTRAVAEIFAASLSAGAGSVSSRVTQANDGTLDACRQARVDAASPPDQCGAVLYLQLAPIAAEVDATPLAPDEGCPEGMTKVGHKCTAAVAAAPRLCGPRDADDCAKQCSAGHAKSCVRLSTLYRVGIAGLSRNAEKSMDLARRACDLGDAEGCAWLGSAYEKTDRAQALALYRKACAAGDPGGCFWIKTLKEDYPVSAADIQDAVAQLQRRCDDANAEACQLLASFYDHGEGVAQDKARAFALWQRACDGGDTTGCGNVGYCYRWGCEGVAIDPRRSVEYFTRACDGGSKETLVSGCEDLGQIYGKGFGSVAQDFAASARYYELACASGQPISCNNLGVLYEEGRGVTADVARALSLYRYACDSKISTGCYRLGTMYERGLGISVDKGRARELYELACRGEEQRGCDNARRLKP